jgi:ATP-dependent Clp protease adaptor protein ClpS
MAKTQSETISRTELRFPGKYNVIILNDDYTPMDFVIQILVEIFNKSLEEAQELTMKVHESGKAIAGTYNRELSEQKKSESVQASRDNGYPLTVLVEKID